MKTTLALCAALAMAGCLGEFIPDPKPASGPPDMVQSGGGGSTGTGGNGSSDMATQAQAPASDAGAAAGTKAFGDTCTVNGDCQSAMCEQFVMGTVHRCSKPCTAATQTADCPAPSDGTCTPNLYCKFDQ
jgi:hypothetical protein